MNHCGVHYLDANTESSGFKSDGLTTIQPTLQKIVRLKIHLKVSSEKKPGRKEICTTQIAREKTRCGHMGYSFRLAGRVLLYASSHRQDNTYHGLCYTSHGALTGTGNSSMCPP